LMTGLLQARNTNCPKKLFPQNIFAVTVVDELIAVILCSNVMHLWENYNKTFDFPPHVLLLYLVKV